MKHHIYHMKHQIYIINHHIYLSLGQATTIKINISTIQYTLSAIYQPSNLPINCQIYFSLDKNHQNHHINYIIYLIRHFINHQNHLMNNHLYIKTFNSTLTSIKKSDTNCINHYLINLSKSEYFNIHMLRVYYCYMLYDHNLLKCFYDVSHVIYYIIIYF